MAVCDRVTESVRIYVMWPFSYSRCAVDIVYFAEKPSLRDASCCSVVVRNGAYGERRYGLPPPVLAPEGAPGRRSGQGGGALGSTAAGVRAFRWPRASPLALAGPPPLAGAPARSRGRSASCAP